MLPYKKSLALCTLLLISGCQSAKTSTLEETPTITTDYAPGEQAYYDSCSTNPECRGYHVVFSGDPAESVGTLVTADDEKSKELLTAAITYIENFDANVAEQTKAFLPEDFPKDLRTSHAIYDGKVLGYDDQYLYVTMNSTSYYLSNEGQLAANGVSSGLAYRFEYKGSEIINYSEPGEDQSGLSAIFPEEILTLFHQVNTGGESWETPEQKADMEARAKTFFNL